MFDQIYATKADAFEAGKTAGRAEERGSGVAATTEWLPPTLWNIDQDAWYLVQTNDMEWSNHDLYVMPGRMVALKLKPEIVRGRPIRIAKVDMAGAAQ